MKKLIHNNTVILVCKSVLYYSSHDEDAFFDWLKKISSIVDYVGKHDELYIHIASTIIADDDLRELLALFHRYKIKNMSQLRVFLNETNRSWFYENKKSYWHKKVFGRNETQ